MNPDAPSVGWKTTESPCLSPAEGLTSPLFSETPRPPKGHGKRPPGGVGLQVLQVLYDEFPASPQPKLIAAMAPYEGTKE